MIAISHIYVYQNTTTLTVVEICLVEGVYGVITRQLIYPCCNLTKFYLIFGLVKGPDLRNLDNI